MTYPRYVPRHRGCACSPPRAAAASPSAGAGQAARQSTRGTRAVVGAPVRRVRAAPRGCTGYRPSIRARGRPRTSCPPVDRIVGADPEQGVVFALDSKRNLDHPRPRDPPRPHLPRAGPLGHDGTGRRALRRRHRQHRHADGSPGPDPVPLEAAGRAQGAARDDDRCAARPGGRQGAGARGARPRPGPGLHDPAVGGHRAELLRRPRGGGHRYRRRDLRDPGQATAAARSTSPGTRATCCSRRRGTASTSPRTTTSCWCSTASAARAAGGHRSARSRPVASRRPLRPVAAGPSGHGRHRLGDRHRPGTVRRTGGRHVGRGSAGGRVAQYAAGPAGQGCPGAGPRRQGTSRRPGASKDGAGDEWLPVAWRPARDVQSDDPGGLRGAGRRRQRPGRGVGLPPGEQLAEPGLGQRARREAAGRGPARLGARADPRATRPTASCSVRTPPGSRRRRPAGRSACRRSSWRGRTRRTADVPRRPRRTHTSIGRMPA